MNLRFIQIYNSRSHITKKSFSPNNHIFYQTARIAIILISFVNFGQFTSGSAIQAKVHSSNQANGKTAHAHAKVEEKVDWPLSFGDDLGPVKAPEKASLPLALRLIASAKGDASHAENNKPFPDADLIDMAKLLAKRRETPQLQIRNTSELHVDTHNADSKEDGFLNNIPSAVYLQKVVVLQKPFHFHLPILSQKAIARDHPTEKAKPKEDDKKRKRSKTTKTRKSNSLKSLVREQDISMIKRDILSQFEEGKALETNSNAGSAQAKSVSNSDPREVDLDHLLKEHPKLIPPVSRKRDSGKLEHHDSTEDDDHHVIGIPLDDDDDAVEQGGSQVMVSKRNVKTIRFSQEAVDSLLGHSDDLIKYRAKIISYAKEIGMTPEEAFHLLVFGVPTTQKLAKESNPHDIYERRLKFHQLFLDDSTESEKYHSEVVDANSPSNKVNPPFNAYMKILKRSKRGLKSWLKKIFKRQPKTTGKPYSRPEPEPIDCRQKRNKRNKECATPFKQDLDDKGDSQVDLLLPQALRRSSYLKRRAELRNAVKEEENIEEEEERSYEAEPTTRVEDSEEFLRYKAKHEDDEDEDRRKRKRNLKRQSNRQKRSSGNKLNKIKLISKDEISVVLEMIFNLVEYQCTEISKKGEIMEGLLTITQTTVRSSSLPDYIPKRRSIVDKLFDKMLDCSSNTENLSKWSHYQLKRRNQKKGGNSASTAGIRRNNGEQILKRKKRVRRDADTTSKAVELISINGTSTTLSDNLVHEEISTTTENISFNISSDYHTLDNESINSVIKLYLVIFKIIPETCFKVDSRLIDESAMVLFQEIMKLERNEEYVKAIEDFVGHFDIGMAEKLLLECYQNEL